MEIAPQTSKTLSKITHLIEILKPRSVQAFNPITGKKYVPVGVYECSYTECEEDERWDRYEFMLNGELMTMYRMYLEDFDDIDQDDRSWQRVTL